MASNSSASPPRTKYGFIDYEYFDSIDIMKILLDIAVDVYNNAN